MIDTAHFKDRLAHAILAMVPVANLDTGEICGEAKMWALNAQNDSDYNRQMASEHKVLVRLSNNRQAHVWMPISSGPPTTTGIARSCSSRWPICSAWTCSFTRGQKKSPSHVSRAGLSGMDGRGCSRIAGRFGGTMDR